MSQLKTHWRRAVVIPTIILMCGTAIPAAASGEAMSEADALASLVELAAPTEELGSVIQVPEGVRMSSPESDVLVPRDATDPVQISNRQVNALARDELVAAGLPADTVIPDLEVALPPELAVEDSAVADDGTSVFPGDTGSMAVQILEDGSVRMMAVLDDATAPLEHTYSFGEGVEPVQLADGSVDLVARTEDGVGLSVGTVAPPWAVDANGVSVATEYVIDGTSLQQVITPVATTEFPIVADPKITVSRSGPLRVYVWMLGHQWETARKVVSSLLAVSATVVCLAAKFPAAIGKVVSSACTLIGAPTGIMALRSALATRVSSVTRYPGFCFRRVVFGPHAPEVRLPPAACG